MCPGCSVFDPQEWQRRRGGADCSFCVAPAENDDPAWVATLPSGRVRLQDDGDFPGYCILSLRRHAVELDELAAAERGQLIEDIARLAAAIDRVCRPAKLNYLSLGNEVPHLHWHVIPRYPDDGWWGRAPSLRPLDQRRPLAPAEFNRLRTALRAALQPT